ncbi:MAG: hypothetical protein F2668_09610 [Actinobacteria bacterium]|uniref:Unannotated protein n=1 Tax=freshwater metagenome TaxID=449393 RepID=A0A6J6R4M9_9ZZZZ|nr:hypothetical protein [Actinomycetota bacterium]
MDTVESLPQDAEPIDGMPDQKARLYAKYAGLDRSSALPWWERNIGPYDTGRAVKEKLTPDEFADRRLLEEQELAAKRKRAWELDAPRREEADRKRQEEEAQLSRMDQQSAEDERRRRAVQEIMGRAKERKRQAVVSAWADVGIPEMVIAAAIANGLTPDLLKGFDLGCLSIDEVAALILGREAGVTRDSLKPWLDCDLTKAQLISAVQFTDVSEQDVHQWVDSGRTPEELLTRLQAGVSPPESLRNIL